MPRADGYYLNKADAEALGGMLAWWRQFHTSRQASRRRATPAGPPLRWGLAAADWAAATPNVVTVNPCRQDGSEADTDKEVTVYVSLPPAAAPADCAIVTGDLVGFLPLYDVTEAEWRGVMISAAPAATVFAAKIGTVAEADTPAQNRWKYAWVEQAKTAVGYDGWSAKDGGRSGSTGTDPAYNRVEDMNTGAGVEGNGVDVANLDTAEYTFAIQPCPSGVIVQMTEITFRVGETDYTEYWFSYENGVDGSCD